MNSTPAYNFQNLFAEQSSVYKKRLETLGRSLLKQVDIILEVIADDISPEIRDAILDDFRSMSFQDINKHVSLYVEFLNKLDAMIVHRLSKSA
jgi:hypothetical protein